MVQPSRPLQPALTGTRRELFPGKPKWIAEQCGTSMATIEQSYGTYIREDGDALLRAYVDKTTGNNLKATVNYGTKYGNLQPRPSKLLKSFIAPVGDSPVGGARLKDRRPRF
jgi:hypothetical protein